MRISGKRLITIIMSVIVSLSSLSVVSAQTATPGRKFRGARRQGINRRPIMPAPERTAPVTVVPQPAPPAYLFGQAQVTVRGNEDPIIRLGLAQHGPIVVEFPASDNFFAVHPGGSNIVTYDESPTLATDHYLVFRAGGGFLTGADTDGSGSSEARASISVQMQSGLFVTFLFYPVRDVARMAHRCVVSYSRDEVVTARRAAGLAVNLDGRTPPTQGSTQQTGSRRIGTGAGSPGDAQARDGNVAVEGQNIGVTLESGELISAASRPSKKRLKPNDMTKEAQRALREAVASPARFNRWSAPSHGLSISATAPVDLDDQRRMTVVAVKNTTQGGLRILAGGPELDVQTLNEGGQVVQVRSIKRLQTESSGAGGALPAGATIYYAIIYEATVLDAAQRVRLSVAQDTAADQPASTELSRTN
jgi:hypothetical protein